MIALLTPGRFSTISALSDLRIPAGDGLSFRQSDIARQRLGSRMRLRSELPRYPVVSKMGSVKRSSVNSNRFHVG